MPERVPHGPTEARLRVLSITQQRAWAHRRSAYAQLSGISLCIDIAHEKKIAGLPQICILTLSLRNLTPPNFCIQAYTRGYASLAGQPYFSLFPVGGARGRKKTSGHSGQLSVPRRTVIIAAGHAHGMQIKTFIQLCVTVL